MEKYWKKHYRKKKKSHFLLCPRPPQKKDEKKYSIASATHYYDVTFSARRVYTTSGHHGDKEFINAHCFQEVFLQVFKAGLVLHWLHSTTDVKNTSEK